MPTEYLDKAGLEYFWSKLKLYIAAQSGGGGGAGGIGDGVPVGMIMDFAGTSLTVPAGYLACDGSAVSRTTYADLFAVIGTTWGSGDGSTTFNLPDLRGRTAIGSGTGTASDATAHTAGDKSGAETHKLTEAQTPVHAHTHNMTQPTIQNHHHEISGSNSYNLTSSSSNAFATGEFKFGTSGTTYTGFVRNTGTGNIVVRDSNNTQNTQPTATGGAVNARVYPSGESESTITEHNNMQPYAVVTKIIKAVPDAPASGGIDLSTTTVSLGTTGWSNNSKTVNVTGVTSSNTVIISPAPADSDAWAEADIICTAQGSGTLTFGCDTVPSTDITANVLILTEEA